VCINAERERITITPSLTTFIAEDKDTLALSIFKRIYKRVYKRIHTRCKWIYKRHAV